MCQQEMFKSHQDYVEHVLQTDIRRETRQEDGLMAVSIIMPNAPTKTRTLVPDAEGKLDFLGLHNLPEWALELAQKEAQEAAKFNQRKDVRERARRKRVSSDAHQAATFAVDEMLKLVMEDWPSPEDATEEQIERESEIIEGFKEMCKDPRVLAAMALIIQETAIDPQVEEVKTAAYNAGWDECLAAHFLEE